MPKLYLLICLLCFTLTETKAQYNTLWIPDTLSGTHFNLTIKDTFAQIVPGNQTITAGINGKFWGPTLFFNKGDTVHMNVVNKLNEATTIHWHGFHLPAVMDGGPHQVIPAGATWQPYWKVTNNASTYWYHPHLHEMTEEHITKGIGGLIIVRDAEEAALALPRTYGVDDIPLVLTDRDFNTQNQFVVVPYGDSMMVNGTLRAQYSVPGQVVRFRILNAAIERSYNIGFSDNRNFSVICSDGGLLNAPVSVNRYQLNAGERIEILVNFAGQTGQSFDLKAYNSALSGFVPGGENFPNGPFGNYLGHKDFNMLHIKVIGQTANPITAIPATLTNNVLLNPADANLTRILTMSDSTGVTNPPILGPNAFIINHKLFNINYNDYQVPLGNTEIWEIRSSSGFGHPFHIHDVEFNILSINGAAPPPAQAGWKDVIFIPRQQTVRFIARFEDYADSSHPFMFHCHIALHEDEGMMGQFVVTQALTANTSATNVACFGNATGAINLNVVGGNPPYTYNWGGGITSQNRTGLAAGAYTVTVTDAIAHTTVKTTTITQPTAALAVSSSGTNTPCFGISNGEINLNVNGGTPVYSYFWNDGNSTQNRSNLPAGTYTVTVTDANQCTQTTTQTITQPNQILAIPEITQVACFGNSSGAITLNTSGGTGAYSFIWNDGATDANRAALPAGNYSATLTDANNCTTTVSATITEPTALTSAATTTPVACFGNATGAITLNTSGGQAGYSYLWNDGNTEQNRSDLPQGAYSATVTDANNCTTSISTTITQPDAPLAVTDSTVDVTCFGASSGAIQLLASGGTPAYTYTWNDGNSDQNRTDLPAGAYSVTLTDANQCTVSVSNIVSQPEAISTAIFATDASCGEQNGSIHADITGGTAPYTILWSDGSVEVDLINIPSRDYGFTVTDANGCTYSDHVIINNIDGPSTSLNATFVNCNGGADGAINLNVIGGAAPFTYQWSDGANTQNRSGLIAGQYIVTVMDANGCSSIVSEIVAQPSAINTYTDVAPDACGQGNGAIILGIVGGTQPYSFNWSNGETNKFLLGISAGIYTVTVTDAHGCTQEITRTVEAVQAPTLTVTKTDVKCYGDLSGAIELSIGDGAQPYEFHWSNGSTADYLAAIPAGAYGLTLTDANGCSRSISETITQPESPLTTSVESANAACFGTASGSINLLPNGGTAPYTFTWSNGANTQQINNLSAAYYSATVTDLYGCITEIAQPITEPAALMVTATSTPAVSSDGTVSATANGGTAPYHFKWNTGQEEAHISNLAPGVYMVTITDANDCSATASALVEMTIATNNLLTVNDLKIQIHPNPTQDRIFVTSNDPGMQAYYVRITNALGKTMYMLPRPQLATGIDVKDFKPGVYFLQLTEEKTKKVFTIQFSKI